MLAALGVRPVGMALAAAAFYALLLLPMASSRTFDLSVFVIAGDHYVDQTRLEVPIAVMPGSLGYDGQFFYRLALDPFSRQKTAHGITFDDPAKRSARIVYPLLAWLASLGRGQLVPAALVLVNLAGLALLAGAAAWLTRTLALPRWFPFAVMAWPGLLIALTDDTAEIAAAAFLLAALAAYLSGRLGVYAVLAAAATLTRETTLPLVVGIAAVEAWRAPGSRSIARIARCVLPLVPFGLWHGIAGAGQHLGGNPDLGWPLAGAGAALRAVLDGSRHWSGSPPLDAAARLFVVGTTLGLLGFCVAVALRLPRLLRARGPAAVAVGWVLTAGLMSLLTADGPWLDPHAYFRAFTETYVVGCLLLALSSPVAAGAVAISVAAIAAVCVGGFNWLWCLSVLP